MKFLRHLAAVVLVVAVIVGLGMLWAHASAGTGIGSGLRRAPSREALPRPEQVKAGLIRVRSDNGFHLADTSDLIRTCEIEAVLAAVVITVGVIRRRHRRLRRTATGVEQPRHSPVPPSQALTGPLAGAGLDVAFGPVSTSHWPGLPCLSDVRKTRQRRSPWTLVSTSAAPRSCRSS